MRIGLRHRGVTLNESLVVVPILALLIGIILPSLRGARRDAKRVVCASGLRSVGQALRMYLNDSDDILPLVASLPSIPPDFGPLRPSIADTLRPYLEQSASTRPRDESVFRCPADLPGFSDRPVPNVDKSFFETEGSSYTFNTELYWLMIENWDDGPENWKFAPTTLYRLVRNEKMVSIYNGQPAEEQVYLMKDYQPFHRRRSGGKDDNQRAFNFLYIDGHVADLER